MRLQNYAAFATMQAGREVIYGAMWDTLTFVSGTTVVLNFFQQSIAGLTPDVTNMQNPGQLPYPWQFLVRAVRLFVKQRPESVGMAAAAAVQTGAVDNIALLVNTGVLNITHGAKQYGPYPLHAITAGNGPYGFAAHGNIGVGGPPLNASIVDYAQNGTPHVRNVFTLAKPLLIETSMNFNYQLAWPAGTVTLTRDLPLCLALEGDLIRQVQ